MAKFFNLKHLIVPTRSRFIYFVFISLGILFFFTTILILFKSIFENEPIWETLKVVLENFKSTVYISVSFVYIIITFLAGISLLFFTLTYKRLILSDKSVAHDRWEEKTLRSGTNSTELFANRLVYAFPDQSGFKWYYSSVAVSRLEKVFKPPLKFGPWEKIDHPTPFWWFRAGSSMCIEHFHRLSRVKILMGSNEFKIKRIGVFISPYHYRSFIYVETRKEKQTGINKLSKFDIKNHVDRFGSSFEEYGILDGRNIISKEDYDDGGTMIKGKIFDTSDSKLRKRYLSDYNFLIGANQSAFNSPSFEEESQYRMDSILKAEIEAEEFIERLKDFTNKED